jgi:YlmC/YmxH family sporulation protein
MRLSDFSGKEVINLSDGARLGVIEECEFYFDSQTGKIQALLLPNRNGMFHLFSDHRTSSIPWNAIKRIGTEIIIVDLNNAWEHLYS